MLSRPHLQPLSLPLLLILCCTMLGACATKTQRTAKALGCGVTSVELLPSEASRRGSTTDWCARCKDAVYRCIGNADRDKLQCRPAREEDRCGDG